jgi:hypothetical protein
MAASDIPQQANLVAGLSTPAVIQMIPLPEITVTLNLTLPPMQLALQLD